MSQYLKIALAAGSTVALAACTVGPNYSPPATPAAAAAPFIGSTSPAVTQATADDRWWRLYNDPVLDGLVKDALAANTDLRVAVANLTKARASLRGSRSQRLPQSDVGAGANYGRTPSIQRLPGMDAESWRVDAGLDLSYEVDLFGRVRRDIEAARGDAAAAEADAEAVRVMVVAETARAYADATSSAERLAVARHIVDLLDQSVALTEKRMEAGRAARLDVARIAALRDQRKALVPQIGAERDSALFRLATLTGRAPRDLPSAAAERQTTLSLDSPIPVGDGRTLLARRPDVRAAEKRLAAATARIGVATADLYPRISLGGSAGSTSPGLGDLFGGGAFRWLVGPLISWSFPNQEAVRARIAGARAGGDVALASFDGTVLTALQETETALSAYAHELQQRAALQSARDESERAVRITRARQREGQIDFLEVLDAERSFADAEASLADSNARVTSAQIALFRALGGGWSKPEVS